MTEKLGFIGLGIMGLPMSLNLRRAGFELAVYNRTPARALPLKDAGAKVCETPAEVAAQADIIFTCVSDTPDVEAALFGKDGVTDGSEKGQASWST